MTAATSPSSATRAANGSAAPSSVHAKVLHRLGELIVSGAISPGAQIQPEVVGDELGASRSVVREALRSLEAKGLVRPRQRTGTRVLPVEHWDLLDGDVITWRTRGPDRVRQLTELMDLRRAIEVAAARHAGTVIDEAGLERLREAVTGMREAARADDADRFTAADITFHHCLLEASGNLLFMQFDDAFSALLRARQELGTLPEHIGSDAIDQHGAVVEALAASDPEAAGRAVSTLVDVSRTELFALLT